MYKVELSNYLKTAEIAEFAENSILLYSYLSGLRALCGEFYENLLIVCWRRYSHLAFERGHNVFGKPFQLLQNDALWRADDVAHVYLIQPRIHLLQLH